MNIHLMMINGDTQNPLSSYGEYYESTSVHLTDLIILLFILSYLRISQSSSVVIELRIRIKSLQFQYCVSSYPSMQTISFWVEQTKINNCPKRQIYRCPSMCVYVWVCMSVWTVRSQFKLNFKVFIKLSSVETASSYTWWVITHKHTTTHSFIVVNTNLVCFSFSLILFYATMCSS